MEEYGGGGLQPIRDLLDSPGGKSQETTETRPCEKCGREFEAAVTIYALRSGPRVIGPKQCPECIARAVAEEAQRVAEEAEEERRALLVAQAGVREQWGESMPRKFWRSTFESWQGRSGLAGVVRDCQQYADGFPLEAPHGYPSLWLFSETNGLGKSHLANAVAHRLFQRWDGDPGRASCPVRYETGPGLLVRIKATYDRGESGHETEEMVYRSLRGVPLLILDDVGKETPSEHTRRVYFHLIDQRYQEDLPVLLATNVPGERLETLLGPDTADRLFEMTQGGQCHTLKGRSFRETRFR